MSRLIENSTDRPTTRGTTYDSLHFFLLIHHDWTSGIAIPHAGLGHVTVRAQTHAMATASVPSDSAVFGYTPPIRRAASSRIHAPYFRTSSAKPVAPDHPPSLDFAT